jgi:Ca2+-binding RTX toxin-like protein
MLFNGSGGDEIFAASANGGRVLFTRNLGNIVMDLDNTERIDLNALGGTDLLTVNDLTGTDVTTVATNLAGTIGGTAGDGAADNVVVANSNDDDVVTIAGQGTQLQVLGLAPLVSITNAEPASDRLTMSALNGDDVVDASEVPAGSMLLTLNGDAGDDVVIGGAGDDILTGGEDDDVLIGGAGMDNLDGGPGDDVLLEGEVVANGQVRGQNWLAAHAERVNGTTVLEHAGNTFSLPEANLVR